MTDFSRHLCNVVKDSLPKLTELELAMVLESVGDDLLRRGFPSGAACHETARELTMSFTRKGRGQFDPLPLAAEIGAAE